MCVVKHVWEMKDKPVSSRLKVNTSILVVPENLQETCFLVPFSHCVECFL